MSSNNNNSDLKQVDYYGSILSAYFDATPKKVWEKAQTYSEMKKTAALFLAIGLFIIIFFQSSTANWSLIATGLAFAIIFFRLMKKTSRQFISQYGIQRDGFFEANRLYWSGERFVLFASALNKVDNIKNANWESIEKLIDNEIELKKFELLKEPFFLFMIPIIGFLFKELFSRVSDLWFILIFITIILTTMFAAQLILAFRNRESKMKELKLFVQWYQQLGDDIKD